MKIKAEILRSYVVQTPQDECRRNRQQLKEAVVVTTVPDITTGTTNNTTSTTAQPAIVPLYSEDALLSSHVLWRNYLITKKETLLFQFSAPQVWKWLKNLELRNTEGHPDHIISKYAAQLSCVLTLVIYIISLLIILTIKHSKPCGHFYG